MRNPTYSVRLMGKRHCGNYLHNGVYQNNSHFLNIRFTSEEGVCGLIIRFLHALNQYEVIANSFDEYLQDLIDDGFIFLESEEE